MIRGASALVLPRGLAVLLALSSPTFAAGALEGWEPAPPLAAAVQRASTERKLVLALVGTSWCSSCRALERGLARLRAPLSRYLRLAYDAEAGEGVDLARRYNAVVFPTLLVLGVDGRERGRVTGDLPPEGLLRAIERIRDGSDTLDALERRAGERPEDLALALRLGSEWALRGERTRALRHLDRVLALDPANRRGLAAGALLARGKLLELRSRREHAAAEATLRELRRRFPASREASDAVYSLAQAIHAQGRTAQALELLEGWARRAEEHDAVAWFCLRHGVRSAIGLRHGARATALKPGEASYWSNLGELQALDGKREAAIASLRRAVALAPAEARTRARLRLLESIPTPTSEVR